MIQNWSSATLDALQNLWQGFVGFIPNLIGAGSYNDPHPNAKIIL